MKIKINRDDFFISLQRLLGIIAEKQTQSLLISGKNNRIEISATDLSISIHSYFDSEIQEEGYCYVPAKLIFDFVKDLPHHSIRIETDKNHLVLYAGEGEKITFKTPLTDESHIIVPRNIEPEQNIEMEGKTLAYIIDQVQPIIIPNVSSTNYSAVGLLYSADPNHMRLVGCDGYRLSYSEMNTEGAAFPNLGKGICLSKRCLQELSRICNDGFDKVSLGISADRSSLVIKVKDYHIFMRLSSVDFPEWDSILSIPNSHEIHLPLKEMLTIIRRVLLASDKKGNNIIFSFNGPELTVSSKNTSYLEAKETISLPSNSFNPAIDIMINGKFFADILQILKTGENFTMKFTDQNTPITIIPENEPSKNKSLHMIVPIEVASESEF